MCHKQSTDSRCSSGCAGNNIKRLRRSILSNNGAYRVDEREVLEAGDAVKSVKRRSTEQRQQVKNYAPSKSYDLNIGPMVQSTSGLGGECLSLNIFQHRFQIFILVYKM